MAKSFVITGSTKGIGFALAACCVARGDKVLISGRSQASVDAALTRLADKGSDLAIGQACDVADKTQVQALWDRAAAEFGQIDVWINNAGVANVDKAIVDIAADDVRNMLHSNMLGTIHGSQVAAAGFVSQGHGRLFNMLGGGSDGEFFAGMGVYGATKRGLDYLTRALVKELKDTPVLVGRVRPGMIVTEGVIREIRANPEAFAKGRKVMNALCDLPETVAPFLIEQMLSTTKSGRKIAWLNGGKIAKRMLSMRFKPREDLYHQVAGL